MMSADHDLHLPEGLSSSDNTETTADPMSLDEQSLDDGGSAENDTAEDLAASALTFGYDAAAASGSTGASAKQLPLSWGFVRRMSSGMEEVVTNITEGQLRSIDLELSAQRRAAVGSFSSRDERRHAHSPIRRAADVIADGTSRRDAVMRADCEFGMDAVGNHVAAVTDWIAEAHETDVTRDESQLSYGFKLRNPLSSRHRRDDTNCVEDHILPDKVEVTGSFEMALAGLNSCLYEAERQRRDEEQNEDRAEFAIVDHVGDVGRIVEAVARIPSLMKTIILIEDTEDRDFVLSNPVIRRAMICPYSIITDEAAYEDSRLKQARQSGDLTESAVASPSLDRGRSWLLEMLKSSDKNLTDKAIDYLEILSSLSAKDYVSIRQPPTFIRQKGNAHVSASRRAPQPNKDDEHEFEDAKEILFKTVGSLNLLIPHFFKLYTSDIERASTLPIIRRALDDAISQPFFTCIIFFDLIFHIILLLSYRFFNFQIVAIRHDIDDLVQVGYGVDFLGYIGLIAAFYFSFRVVGDIISMSSISWHVFCANFFHLWQLVEITAITMVMVSLCVIRVLNIKDIIRYRGDELFIFNAFTTGLLWLNFVGFLRILNWKLATFVLAIIQIIRDISLFLLLMLIVVVSFGDMFYTIIASDPDICYNSAGWVQTLLEKLGLTSEDLSGLYLVPAPNRTGGTGVTDEESPICQDRGLSYFAIYRVLIGDVSADEFAFNPVTTILFVIMTFLGIIIMLNILIAIVDESYERSTMRAERLFGSARIALVAKIAALEELLHPVGPLHSNDRFFFRAMGRECLLHNLMSLLAFAVAGVIAWVVAIIAKITHDAFMNLAIGKGASIALVAIVVVPSGVFIIVATSFLLTGWKREKEVTQFKLLQKCQKSRINKYCFLYPVSFIVRSLLGTSQFFKRRNQSHEEAWHGRLNHMKRSVQTCVSESESRMRDVISRLEMKLEKEEELRRSDAVEFEKRLTQMEDRAKVMRKKELNELESRIVQAMAMTLSEHLKTEDKHRETGQQQD